MVDGLSSALTSINAIVDIGKSLVGARDSSIIDKATIDITSNLINVQSLIVQAQRNESLLLSEIDKLKDEVIHLKDWSAERKDYQLKEIAHGIFAYINNNAVGDLKSIQKLCCNCFDNKHIKSTLQQLDQPNGTMALTCSNGCHKMPISFYLNDDQ